LRLITAMEELALFEDGAIDEASSAVADALRFRDDSGRYRTALAAFGNVPIAARWIVELIVECELAANAQPLRYPCGLRSFVT